MSCRHCICHSCAESPRYIIVGGRPFIAYDGSTTFTSIDVLGVAHTLIDAHEKAKDLYDMCDGLLLVIDTHTGSAVDEPVAPPCELTPLEAEKFRRQIYMTKSK